MTRDHLRRIVAIEQGRGELPAEIRAWLGDPVTDEEHAKANARASISLGMLPPDAQRWLDERTFTGAEH